MSELAPLSVRAGPSHHEVFAEGALNFGGIEACLFVSEGMRKGEFLFLGLSIRFRLVGRACCVGEESSLLTDYHLLNDYYRDFSYQVTLVKEISDKVRLMEGEPKNRCNTNDIDRDVDGI